MEQNGQLSGYRQHLVEALRQHPRRRYREEPGSLQVFVNQECIGTLDCGWGGTSLVSVSQDKPIRVIELRTASGVLAGSLCARDIGVQTARFPVGPHAIEVSICNQLDRGTLRAEFRPAVSFIQRVRRVASATLAAVRRPGWMMRPLPGIAHRTGWGRAAVLSQTALALAVLFLVVDRLADRTGTWKTVTTSAAEKAFVRQEHRLAKLVEQQASVIQAIKVQQRDVARLDRAVAAADRQSRKRHEAEALLLSRLSSEAADRERMWNEIQSLTAAKEALSKDVAVLESRAVVAEARRENSVQPFRFWVSFHDGTSDKSIEELIQGIHGRKGPVDAGWYSVEVNLSQPQSPATFVESLRKTKIVKAVKTNLTTTQGQ